MRAVLVAMGAVVFLIAGAFAFGFSGEDVSKMRAFADGVQRWQIDPDFRKVQDEYVRLGSAAMRTRFWGIRASDMVMGFRSLPGLPPHLAVSPTSAAHYDAFSRGELSAYLHLSQEQGIADALGMVEQLGAETDLSDERVREFLRGFTLPVPIATDAGAVKSVRKLLSDIEASRKLQMRVQPTGLFGPHIAGLAREFGSPTNPLWMNPLQQQLVYRELDRRVRAEPELWRTKQVSDFLCGIWAQGYGQIYLTGIEWALRLRLIGRVIVLGFLGVFVLILTVRKKKAHARLCVGV